MQPNTHSGTFFIYFFQDELELVKGAGNQGRGKDISTIVNAEKDDVQQQQPLTLTTTTTTATTLDDSSQPTVVPSDIDLKPAIKSTPEDDHHDEGEQEEEEEAQIRPVVKLKGRKKPRKLNSLDISSEDDEDSDEDFKGTTTEEEDEEEEEYDASDYASESSESYRRGRGKKGPIRRSTRARISRYDREFSEYDYDTIFYIINLHNHT